MDQSPSHQGTSVHAVIAEVHGWNGACQATFGQRVRVMQARETERNRKMKSNVRALAAGLFLLAGTGVATAQTVVIAPEQETVIREYVKSKPVASIDLPGIELNIGSTVPATVEIHKIDAPDVTYSYTVVGGRTYVVEPGTRKIVKILD
jgi:hypothetical protein